MSTTLSPAKTQLLIGGQWSDASTGESYVNENPATGRPLAEVASASAADVDRAVSAARAAFDSGKWASMPASRRAKILLKMAQLISERASELALLEVRDNGKPLGTAKGEIGAIVETFEFYAGAATKNYGLTIPGPTSS
ncbi:MAG: aldehyde dehydrogenase family protein, partial [Candidatus Eremiobacteraeota bacterium]|nr:aldehyde dehydrogenase family protein [Candidatus Eremiobacteraeota bacterium]